MNGAVELNDSAPLDEDEGGAPLPWAKWLHVSARRIDRDPDERAEILADEAIEPPQWKEADRYWSLRIAESLSEGDHSLSNQVAAACVRELAERKRAASAGAPATGDAPLPTSPRAAPEQLAPTGEPARPAEVTPPARVAPAVQKTPLDMGTAIGAIPGVPALPFAPGAPGSSAVERAKQHASEVQSPAAALRPDSAAASPQQGASRGAPRPPIGETEAVDVGALARRVLAFGPPKTEPERQQARIAPPPTSQASALPALTVEQYASLCVDLELSPHGGAEALRRYGITQEGKRTLDDGWSRVFTEQPSRRAAFEHAKATYRAWLERGGR